MMKKRMILLLLFVFVLGWLLCRPQKLDTYDIRRFNSLVADGKELSLAEVFPGEWDQVHIMHTPSRNDVDYDKLQSFAEENNISLFMVDTFYLLVFTQKDEIVGLIQYRPGSGGPTFLDRGRFREVWIQSVPRDEAVFACHKVRSDGELGVLGLQSTLYALELKVDP